MDISTLVQTDALGELELRHPVSDEPLGITIQVRSAESETVRAVGRKYANKFLSKNKKPKADAIEAEFVDKAVAMIDGWDWNGESWDGSVVEDFDPKLATTILSHPDGAWIYEQITDFAGDRANFTGK